MFMRPHVIVLVMRSGGGLMGVRGLQMAFSRGRVMCSRHNRYPHPLGCSPHPPGSLPATAPNLVNPPEPPKTHKTPVNTGDLYFQNLA
jgi:hypothetical protein